MMYSSAIEHCSATKKCRRETNNETDGRLVFVVASNVFCDCSSKMKVVMFALVNWRLVDVVAREAQVVYCCKSIP